jgi:hypothetical protein
MAGVVRVGDSARHEFKILLKNPEGLLLDFMFLKVKGLGHSCTTVVFETCYGISTIP